MDQWNPTPIELFWATLTASALSGLAELLHSTRPVTIRSICGTLLFYGAAGTGLGAFVYEFLGGKTRPVLVLSSGLLVGIRAIKIQDIAAIVFKIFGSHGQDDKKD